MSANINELLAKQFNLKQWQVDNTVKLLDEGNTVPFIARYRKELHGSLDDQIIRELAEKLEYLRNLEKRREEVRSLIEAQEKLTDEISAALNEAKTITEIDDIYRPFRPKRKTRASVAKEKAFLTVNSEVAYEKDNDHYQYRYRKTPLCKYALTAVLILFLLLASHRSPLSDPAQDPILRIFFSNPYCICMPVPIFPTRCIPAII